MAFTGNSLRPGMVIQYNDQIWSCMEAIHKTPGNKRAFVQAKLRNILGGHQTVVKLSATEPLERVDLREKPMQYLYQDGDNYCFMDSQDYEQIQLSRDFLGDNINYLLENTEVSITFFENTPVGMKLPTTMNFKIIDAEPNLSGATAKATYKNAVIETGLQVKVPQFIEPDEVIVINTETGEYQSRAK